MNSAGILSASRIIHPQVQTGVKKSNDKGTTGGRERRIKVGTENCNSQTTAVIAL
jgi:hypothetical protein